MYNVEPATPFATGEKIYKESKKPTKSFGQLLLSLIVMQKSQHYSVHCESLDMIYSNSDENISKKGMNCSLLDTFML